MINYPLQIVCGMKGHTEIVSTVSFSSDGRNVLSASWDHTVKVRVQEALKDCIFEPKSMHIAHSTRKAVVPTKLTYSANKLGTQCGNG